MMVSRAELHFKYFKFDAGRRAFRRFDSARAHHFRWLDDVRAALWRAPLNLLVISLFLVAEGLVVLPRVNGLLFQFATRPARTTRIPALLETSPGLDLCSAH